MSIGYNLRVDSRSPEAGKTGSRPVSITPKRLKATLSHYLAAMCAITLVVFVYSRLPNVNPTTVALTFLLVVLGVASRWGLTVATTTAVVATLAFNYFFLPPVHTFTIADPQNWIALLAFLISAIVASRLSERARREAMNATRRRKELERLYSLSQQLLATENVMEMLNSIPRLVRDAFGLKPDALSWKPQNIAAHRDTCKRRWRVDAAPVENSARPAEKARGRGELCPLRAESAICSLAGAQWPNRTARASLFSRASRNGAGL